MWPWKKPEKEPVTVQTPVGQFVQIFSGWEALIDIAGAQVQVLADDNSGAPDPAFLARLPAIIGDLPALAEVARRDAPVSEKHQLTLITETSSEADFSLSFSYEEEAWGETVFVDFRGRSVVGWCSAD